MASARKYIRYIKTHTDIPPIWVHDQHQVNESHPISLAQPRDVFQNLIKENTDKEII